MFQEAYQFVFEQLGKNDLIAGGAVLGALAFSIRWLQRVPFTLLRWSKLAFVTQIDIPDRSDTFKWVKAWLAAHKYCQKSKRITVENIQGKSISAIQTETEKTETPAQITPAPGRHLVWWGWTPVIIDRIRREGSNDNAHRAIREGWTITLIGKRKKVNDFIAECRKAYVQDKDDWLTIHEAERGYWESGAKRRKRPIETVILPKGMSDTLMNDVRQFIDSEQWYKEMSVPWRRGYLLTGPPGNGKSSIITAVASETGFEIHILNLKITEEDDLVTAINGLPANSILLLEDIDCAFEKREGKSGISLSTLLNSIDGVNATEGRLLFMTTNHPDKLDPALIRAGRIDRKFELPNANKSQVKQMYERFYPDSENSEEFATDVDKFGVSMAQVQGHFLRFRHSCRDARSHIKEIEDA